MLPVPFGRDDCILLTHARESSGVSRHRLQGRMTGKVSILDHACFFVIFSAEFSGIERVS